MTAPDSPITAPGTLDTSTGEPTEMDVRILPAPGKLQETAQVLLAAAGDDPQKVLYHPPHFIVSREIAEDAGLLEQENPSPRVHLHDRTVPFPPLYPASEAHTMTPLAPPGEKSLTVESTAHFKDAGDDPAEAPGAHLPLAGEDTRRTWDSTGTGEGDPQGRLAAERRLDELGDPDLAYPNPFAGRVERERGVVPSEPHTGLAQAEVLDREGYEARLAEPVDDRPTDSGDDVDAGRVQESPSEREWGQDAGEAVASPSGDEDYADRDPGRDAEESLQGVLVNAGVTPDDGEQGGTHQGAVALPSDGSDGASAPEPVDEALGPDETRAARQESTDVDTSSMTVEQIKDGLDRGELDPAQVRRSELDGKRRKGVLSLVEE